MKPPVDDDLLVTCLCAEWCGTCREYRTVFEQVAENHPGARWRWVDIEDENEVLGDLDVENFPTLCILRGSDVLFFGPVLPHAHTLDRLARNAAAHDLTPRTERALISLGRRLWAAVAD